MNLQKNIRKVLREESQKQSLLSLLDQYGLYEFMKMAGLSLQEIISKVGELSREVLESYIRDFLEENAQTIAGSDGDKGLVFPVPLSKNIEVESFYLCKGVVTVEVNEYDSDERVVAGSIDILSNLSDDEIYKLVKELIDWGNDTYYEI